MLNGVIMKQRIRQTTVRNLARYRGASPESMASRLDDLSAECTVERAMQASAAALILAGLAGALADRRFLFISAAGAGFLIHHFVLRRLGFRTGTEVAAERLALARVLRAREIAALEQP